jgi:hypothetical protein
MEFDGDRITAIYFLRNPDKLGRIVRGAAFARSVNDAARSR